jgi:hypothetical protein
MAGGGGNWVVYNARRRRRWPSALVVAAAAAVRALVGLGGRGVGPLASIEPDRGGGQELVFDDEASATATSTTLYDLEGRSYRPGDCVVWDEAERVRHDAYTDVVGCDVPHVLEMTGHVTLSDPFRAPYPTDAQWMAIYEDRCGPKTLSHLGYALWPDGRFTTSGVQPTAAGWRNGDREVWCGIEAQPPAGVVVTDPDAKVLFTGRVKDQDQHRLMDRGACVSSARDGSPGASSTSAVVACDLPHHFEVAGSIDIGGRTSPPPADWDDDGLVAQCEKVAVEYLGRKLRRDEWASWFAISDAQWAEGWRKLECSVARSAPGSDDPAAITGPLASAP